MKPRNAQERAISIKNLLGTKMEASTQKAITRIPRISMATIRSAEVGPRKTRYKQRKQQNISANEKYAGIPEKVIQRPP